MAKLEQTTSTEYGKYKTEFSVDTLNAAVFAIFYTSSIMNIVNVADTFAAIDKVNIAHDVLTPLAYTRMRVPWRHHVQFRWWGYDGSIEKHDPSLQRHCAFPAA